MIVIFAGHGGKHSGTIVNGLKEVDVNFDIVSSCFDELSLHTDKFIWANPLKSTTMNVEQRAEYLVKLGKKFGKLDVHIIHCDYNPNTKLRGMTLYLSKYNTKEKNSFDDFFYEYEKQFNIPKFGIKTRKTTSGKDYYCVHRESGENAIVKLWEMGFLSNRTDRSILSGNRKQIGISMARMILKHNNIEFKKHELPKVKYILQAGAFSNLEYAKNEQKHLKSKGIDTFIKEI